MILSVPFPGWLRKENTRLLPAHTGGVLILLPADTGLIQGTLFVRGSGALWAVVAFYCVDLEHYTCVSQQCSAFQADWPPPKAVRVIWVRFYSL